LSSRGQRSSDRRRADARCRAGQQQRGGGHGAASRSTATMRSVTRCGGTPSMSAQIRNARRSPRCSGASGRRASPSHQTRAGAFFGDAMRFRAVVVCAPRLSNAGPGW
jgi:hypothetical protein